MLHQRHNTGRKDTCSAGYPALVEGTAVQSNSKNLLDTKIFLVQFNWSLESQCTVDKIDGRHMHGSPGELHTEMPYSPALNLERVVSPPKMACTHVLTYYWIIDTDLDTCARLAILPLLYSVMIFTLTSVVQNKAFSSFLRGMRDNV